MLSLQDSTQTLVVVLDTDPATNQPVALVSTNLGENVVATLTGDTAKELLAGEDNPAKDKEVTEVLIYNKDTATVNATISKKVASTTYDLVREDIPAGGTLFWVPGSPAVVTAGAATAIATVGASAQPEVTAAESGFGNFRTTVLTLTDLPITVGNTTGVSFGNVKLYDFPEGRHNFLGVQLNDLTVDLTDVLNVTPIAGTHGGDVSLGTTGTSDATLNGTDVNLMPSTSIDPISAGIADGALVAAATVLDGRTTALDLYLNMIIDDADVADGASDVLLLSGTITVTWVNLGND